MLQENLTFATYTPDRIKPSGHIVGGGIAVAMALEDQ
jgi:hypothetical protein